MRPPKGFKPASVFDRDQIGMFVEAMIDRVGGRAAWNFVGPHIRAMACDAQAYRVMAAQTYRGAMFTATDMHQVRHDIAVFSGAVED